MIYSFPPKLRLVPATFEADFTTLVDCFVQEDSHFTKREHLNSGLLSHRVTTLRLRPDAPFPSQLHNQQLGVDIRHFQIEDAPQKLESRLCPAITDK